MYSMRKALVATGLVLLKLNPMINHSSYFTSDVETSNDEQQYSLDRTKYIDSSGNAIGCFSMLQVIQESEVMVFLIGISVLVFILLNWKHLKPLTTRKPLLLSFCALIVGWLLTILEGFFFEDVLNFFEHLCFSISAILLVIWCRSEFRNQEREI